MINTVSSCGVLRQVRHKCPGERNDKKRKTKFRGMN